MNTSLYRSAWRWHFYAGLFVLPVLVWLAVTGALYLYKPEIERIVYRDWTRLEAPARPLPADEMIRRVEQAARARVVQLIRPAAPDESWRMTLEIGEGRRTAFVDPGKGAVLGTTSDGGVMKTVRDLHGLAITGPVGNALVEIAAGWAIVMVATGFVLWWPRSGRRALALRGAARERRFWRDLHASAGAVVGLVILFLAVTGMPWSVFWGANLQKLVAAQGLGRPAPPGVQAAANDGHHGSGHDGSDKDSLPWSLQAAAVPHAHGGGIVGAARILAVAEARGLVAPYMLNLPTRPGAPYSVGRIADRAGDIRLIHLDPASGGVLQDVSAKDFGPGARMIEWGIYTHQGQTYGEVNRLVMLAGCIGILLLAGSAPVLWWKRRRPGRLDAPPRPPAGSAPRRLGMVMAVLGLLYPLTGATMLIAWAADRLLLRRTARGSEEEPG